MKLLHQAQDIMGEAIAEYNPSHVFVLFSGGYDSLVTTHLATAYLQKAHAVPFKVAHINTGIGIEETRQFVRDMRERYQWPYAEYKTRSDYREIVCKHGFPGPAFHKLMYILLKERPLDDLIRDHTDQEQKKRERPKIMFITGVRRQESQRRMGHVEPVTVEGRRVWVAPLTEWDKTDILNYIAVRSLSHNEVVDTLHMSGECLCGAYAHAGELAEIETFYPKTGQEIREIEQLVRAAGFPWGWEDRPPAWFNQVKKGQEFLEGFDPEFTESHLCATCDARFEGSRRAG